MSTCYWMIEGIGLEVGQLYDRIDKRKLVNFLSEQLPDDESLQEWKHKRNIQDFEFDEYLYGGLFHNIADFFTHFDDTNTLNYGDDGDGAYFLYYPPMMPWLVSENEPKSIEDVHQRIVKAIMPITDLKPQEIEDLIDDDLYRVGMG